jgi:hypothetical protein
MGKVIGMSEKNPLEQILKNNEDLILRFLDILQGRKTKAKVNLDGIRFKVGKTDIEVNGMIELSINPKGKGR